MTAPRPFLSEIPLRPIALAHQPRFRVRGLALGAGVAVLEVVIADHDGQPAMTALRSAWKVRNGGRAAPLLFVALYGDKCALCGPAG